MKTGYIECTNCCTHLNTETIEGSDDEGVVGGHYEAKASKKKEKRRQEREAARQVHFLSLLIFHAFFSPFSVLSKATFQ